MEAQMALSLAERNHDFYFAAWCWWTLSSIDAQRGDWAGALTATATCVEMARRHGVQDLLIWATARQAEIQRIRGYYREAAREHGRLLAAFEHSGDVDGTLWAVQGKAQCDLMLGDIAAALMGYWRSSSISRRAGDPRSSGWASRGEAECLLRVGNLPGARTAATTALTAFDECGYAIGRMYAVRTLVDIDLISAPSAALQQALDAVRSRGVKELPRENAYLSNAAARAAHACHHDVLAARLASCTLAASDQLKCTLVQVESHLILAQTSASGRPDNCWRNHLTQACRLADISGLAVELATASACLSQPSLRSRLHTYRSGGIFRPRLQLSEPGSLLAE